MLLASIEIEARVKVVTTLSSGSFIDGDSPLPLFKDVVSTVVSSFFMTFCRDAGKETLVAHSKRRQAKKKKRPPALLMRSQEGACLFPLIQRTWPPLPQGGWRSWLPWVAHLTVVMLMLAPMPLPRGQVGPSC